MSDSTAMANRCEATTKGGQPCQLVALPGSVFCWWHDPDRAGERAEARSKGGRARHGRSLGEVAGNGRQVKIDSLADVVQVLAGELGEVLTLERSISRARAVGYLCGVLAQIYTSSELEARLAALERAVVN